MIFRNVTAYGRPATIACDARCDKAWGWNARPKVQLSDDPDDVEWLADGELGDAPTVSSISEGGDGKPQHPGWPRGAGGGRQAVKPPPVTLPAHWRSIAVCLRSSSP